MVSKLAAYIQNDVAAAALAGIAGAAALLVSAFAGLPAAYSLHIEGAGMALLAFVPVAIARARVTGGSDEQASIAD